MHYATHPGEIILVANADRRSHNANIFQNFVLLVITLVYYE